MALVLIIEVENFTVDLSKITLDLSLSVLIGNHTSVFSDNIGFFGLNYFLLMLDSSSVAVNLTDKRLDSYFQTIILVLL
jgi:hypothetical protein